MTKLVVIGSSSIDLVVTAHKRPEKGETILGESFKTVPGGKGANQAVAAARLGADVYMVGCVGQDDFGRTILENFKKNGVNTEYMEPVTDIETGTAHITLAEGDNSIIVVQGANKYVSPDYIEKAMDVFDNADMVLIQQEIPAETVEYVAEICNEKGIPLLLNPAPSRPVSQAVIEKATYITPNETEAAVLFAGENAKEAMKKYHNKVFITEGSKGVRFHDGQKEVLVPSYKVEAVDTTGAGDTFNAAFAVALSEGKSIQDSIQFANRAASLSVTKFGAQGGMPTRAEVEGSL
ncbi:ribokinase [Mesobacillus maritimus]|uniref:ribokinase n=1 Tax=Mesobacillus maritimus TaxID=1643336 RepID=UPI00203E6E5E|nr:ribokinase [Mesobacillus maritimus]MCM3584617.1 ribokinase [Mesobacillus maritimus]MCM3671405.1 ribokinase [Mesobacillus maritimus]